MSPPLYYVEKLIKKPNCHIIFFFLNVWGRGIGISSNVHVRVCPTWRSVGTPIQNNCMCASFCIFTNRFQYCGRLSPFCIVPFFPPICIWQSPSLFFTLIFNRLSINTHLSITNSHYLQTINQTNYHLSYFPCPLRHGSSTCFLPLLLPFHEMRICRLWLGGWACHLLRWRWRFRHNGWVF